MTAFSFLLAVTLAANPVDGNRLAYLDGHDIYYPHAKFPKLITPQWVGEDGVEAVVVLAIDDMRDPPKYEAYLRPILQRLKAIDGRAPVSIMTCAVKPDDPQLQTWLNEGLSLEIHTFDHPCPLLQGGDFAKAKGTYDKCVDLLFSIPNNTPVAFRMPCCDSLNTVSPRFYKEIFNKTTPDGKFLQISSSVFQVFTAADSEIPPELLFDADGKERFRKYFPKGLKRGDQTHDRFVNYIENYPYPYVIDRLCWEFPCMTPSDWEANFLHQPNNPQTVEDMKAALDITVHKQGVLNLVFHPHGWIKAEQVNELIDHAVAKHGKKVKFLTFKEALERLNKNLLAGQPLRDEKGNDNGVSLNDLNLDGYLDVLTTTASQGKTRLWSAKDRIWSDADGPTATDPAKNVFRPIFTETIWTKPVCILARGVGASDHLWSWNVEQAKWEHYNLGPIVTWLGLMTGDEVRAAAIPSAVKLLALETGTGPILVFQGERQQTPKVLTSAGTSPAAVHDDWFPPGAVLHSADGKERGLRFIDIDEDGNRDLVWSNSDSYGVYLFEAAKSGWSIELLSGQRGSKPADQELPPIVRADVTDNGFFVRDRALHWMNEDTAHLPNLIVSVDFDKLLGDRLPAPKTPKAALDSLRPRPGFTVELMACEPKVMDPVAMAWGPDGKFWVVEMADYPNGMDGRGQPGGRVRFLEDSDGDGQYDKSTLFLDNVPFPNGVHPWKNGVLISAAPDVFFAADTDGDGNADVREVLYTGFAEGNQQHRVNGFTYGLDGWLYLANGDSGGGITSTKTGEKLDLRGRDLRIHPETGKMDAVSGQSQFGRARDEWGNWFGNNNSRPLFHYVLEDHYLRRNPHYAAPDPRRDVSMQPGNAPVFPASKTLTRFNDFHTANRFTSACSAIVYRDDLFLEERKAESGKRNAREDEEERKVESGKQKAREDAAAESLSGFPPTAFRPPLPSGSPLSALRFPPSLTFVSEPVHNLVHCELMTLQGVSFTSRRLDDEQQSEFLASTDNWFRPTQIKTGPDGALWIADMYRLVIEHPQWIPQEWQEKLDVRAGEDKGRIWRVYPANKQPRTIPRLDKLTTAELVAALDSPSGWQRDLVQQLLIERKDAEATSLLKDVVARGAKPQARLQALGVLDGLGALTLDVLLPALRDEHPGVRRWAVRLVGERGEVSRALWAALEQLADDPDPLVRMQLAYSLGDLPVWSHGQMLAKLAREGQGDKFLLAAVFSSLNALNIDGFTAAVVADRTADSLTDDFVNELLSQLVAFDRPAALGPILGGTLERPLTKWSAADWRLVERFLTSMARVGHPWKKWSEQAGGSQPGGVNPATLARQLQERLTEAVRLAQDESVPSELRVGAARLSRYAEWQGDALAESLRRLLQPTQPPEVQLAAVQMFGSRGDTAVTAALIGRWRELSPNTRAAARDALLGRTNGCQALLAAVETGQLAAVDFDAVTRQRLIDHQDATIRQRAETLLGATTSSARAEVIARYQPVVRSGGDAPRGGELFRKTCSQCHKLNDAGHAVGPDLQSLIDKSPEALLTAILDPNRAVETKFLTYTAVTAQGQSFTGLLESETATGLTLLAAEAKRHTLLRTDLEELVAANKSLMPEGLEKDISPEAMADLIAFVRANVPLPKRKEFPGNAPRVVAAEADGRLVLTPQACEIYGSTIVLEEKYGNLGWWSSADDTVVWTVDVPAAGEYAVRIEWACDPQAAGHRLVIDGGKRPLVHRVTGTANWDDYQTAELGRLELDRGVQRLTLRPASRPLPALLDLKSVTLVPVK